MTFSWLACWPLSIYNQYFKQKSTHSSLVQVLFRHILKAQTAILYYCMYMAFYIAVNFLLFWESLHYLRVLVVPRAPRRPTSVTRSRTLRPWLILGAPGMSPGTWGVAGHLGHRWAPGTRLRLTWCVHFVPDWVIWVTYNSMWIEQT